MDDDLSRILLEGGGGGQKTESYELAMYFMARHTVTDCYAKRGKRGYLFLIGDEMAYPRVKRAEVASVIGDGLQADIPLAEIVAELTRDWDTYYILPEGASYAGDAEVLSFWRGLLGQNVIELADLDAVSETIALTVGLGEDAISLDDGLADLDDVGSDAGAGGVEGARRDRLGPRRADHLGRRSTTWTATTGTSGCDRGGHARPAERAGEHVIVVDLGFGDAGKGTVVDWLCSRASARRRARRSARTVVRFNGGAQAAHNVVTPDGRHHTFAQFGSGTFTPGVRTHLSRFVLVDPLALAAEAAHLASAGVAGPARPADRRPGRAAHHAVPPGREPGQRTGPRRGRHGSCGMGIGETASYALGVRADAPRVGDCDDPAAAGSASSRCCATRVRAEFGATARSAASPRCPRSATSARPAGRSPAGSASSTASTWPACCAPGRWSSRAPRGCCSTNGTASIRTPPGRRPRSPTRDAARRGGRDRWRGQARRRPLLPDQARTWPAGHRGSDA